MHSILLQKSAVITQEWLLIIVNNHLVTFREQVLLLISEIFLMENSRPLRLVLTATLRDAGYNVTSFEDSVAFTDSDLLANADVLVTNVSMPIVGGIEVISNVKQRFPDLPIIAMTEKHRGTLYQLEIFGRLRKPFRGHELVDLVQRALQSRKQPKPKGRIPRSEAS